MDLTDSQGVALVLLILMASADIALRVHLGEGFRALMTLIAAVAGYVLAIVIPTLTYVLGGLSGPWLLWSDSSTALFTIGVGTGLVGGRLLDAWRVWKVMRLLKRMQRGPWPFTVFLSPLNQPRPSDKDMRSTAYSDNAEPNSDLDPDKQ